MSQNEPRFVAVVDTNVFLDIYSCHDLAGTYDRVGEAGVDGSDALYRRARARESLLLALYFHRIDAEVIGLGEEILAKLRTNVDPEVRDRFEPVFTRLMVHFVMPRVLKGWRSLKPEAIGEHKGNAADSALVASARDRGLPLITNEGFKPDGYYEGKIATRAKAEGVRVFFPREFYGGQINEGKEIDDFFRRLHNEARVYIAASPRPEPVDNAFKLMDSYFRHVLLGESSRGEPVLVTIDPGR